MQNVEIKARYTWSHETDDILKALDAEFVGVEIQQDTYYHVDNGRLKIRERKPGRPQLIQYFREDVNAPRPSKYGLVYIKNVDTVKTIMEREHGQLTQVRKHREIWMWQDVRIHFDRVETLGDFIEFEALVEKLKSPAQAMKKVVTLMKQFQISRKELISRSYSDMMLKPDADD